MGMWALKNVCRESSSSRPHIWHIPVVAIPLRNMFTWVAIALQHIFQARVWTLGGTRHFQISRQLGLTPSCRELVAPQSCCIMSRWSARRYALLTVNNPFFSGNQATKSSSFLVEGLMRVMSLMSSWTKYCSKRSIFHVPSASKKSATHLYRHLPCSIVVAR
jgi:hypothetical protein